MKNYRIKLSFIFKRAFRVGEFEGGDIINVDNDLRCTVGKCISLIQNVTNFQTNTKTYNIESNSPNIRPSKIDLEDSVTSKKQLRGKAGFLFNLVKIAGNAGIQCKNFSSLYIAAKLARGCAKWYIQLLHIPLRHTYGHINTYASIYSLLKMDDIISRTDTGQGVSQLQHKMYQNIKLSSYHCIGLESVI